jgi:hypothetical protein
VNDQTSTELAARFCNFRGAEGEHVNGRVVSVEIGGRYYLAELR